MKLWGRSSGAFKDRHSLWLTTLRRKTSLQNPEIEVAVIKATNHDEFFLDYTYSSRVFAWVRMSPTYVKPLVWAITYRVEKTRCWIVALKSLMLMHGVFCCKVVAIERIGRLPFDLSRFRDRHTHNNQIIWGYNDFIRAYYTFLDQKSAFIFLHAQEKRKSLKLPKIGDDQITRTASDSLMLMQDLVSLQTMQGLLDLLMQIKPATNAMKSYRMMSPLIIEAMDCIVIEIFDVYSRICRAIAMVLTKIESAGTAEASLALKIMKTAIIQSDQLASYLHFCQCVGVPNAEGCPKLKPIPEEDIKEVENVLAERISARFIPHQENCKSLVVDSQAQDNITCPDIDEENHKALVVDEMNKVHEEDKSKLKTIITSKWQVFEDDCSSTNPFLTPYDQPLLALDPPPQELPDLISFD
ncbi:putative clathrin assembly protein [Heracleum sosnowskyi]|uniref:Clathrin assembly protein n=1 Tax=Heracleum sosnowskyi TaxID=360622 RepID=A0AAD8I7R9_9APIA|nr:putative clathrin assembly protein [Heracleum sosnowskyi]